MNITKIISKTFDSRLKQIDLYATQASEIQHRVLNRLVQQAARTEWGKSTTTPLSAAMKISENAFPFRLMKKLSPMWNVCGQENKTCFGRRKYAGSPNHPVRLMIKVSFFPSARKPWRIFITEVAKMPRLFISVSIRTATSFPARD